MSFNLAERAVLVLLLLRSALGMTHDLQSDLWWTIPLRILLGQFWDTSLDYTQKSTISTLAVRLSVSAIIYSRWTATITSFHFTLQGRLHFLYVHCTSFGKCYFIWYFWRDTEWTISLIIPSHIYLPCYSGRGNVFGSVHLSVCQSMCALWAEH